MPITDDLAKLRARVEGLCQMTNTPGWIEVVKFYKAEYERFRREFDGADQDERWRLSGMRNCLCDLHSVVWSPFIALKVRDDNAPYEWDHEHEAIRRIGEDG